LIKLPNKPRPFWLLGRVLEIIIGFDDKIRSVKLLQGNGEVAHHSICHLFPLELTITHDGKGQQLNKETDNEPEQIETTDVNPENSIDLITTEQKRPKRLP
jgi:hypothetical protein